MDIIAKIKDGTPKWVNDARKQHKVLNALVNGIGAAELIAKIEELENDDQYKLRKKYGGNVKHVVSQVLQPRAKVFFAKGGSQSIGLSEKNLKDFYKKLKDVKGGQGLRNWIMTVQANKYDSDPNGIVLFEYKDGVTWPMAYSIDQILDYKNDGRKLEWVLFEGVKKEDETHYRYIDGESDKVFIKRGEVITEDLGAATKNPWGYVQGFVNSDYINPVTERNDTHLECVLHLLETYLLTYANWNILRLKHGVPMFWMYGNLTDLIPSRNDVIEDYSNGRENIVRGRERRTFRKNVDQVTILTPPMNSDDPKIAPDIAGYIVPPLESIRQIKDDLTYLKDNITYSIWGTVINYFGQDSSTATGRILDVQAANEKNNFYRQSFEDVEQRCIDIMGKFYYGDAYNKDESVTNYGTRYMLEGSDALYHEYINGRKEGLSKALLDHRLVQYYHAEYQNDPYTLAIMLKSVYLEPFIHHTDEELLKLNVEPKDYMAKIYFSEWWEMTDRDYILQTPVEKLSKDFKQFIDAKSTNI